MDLCGLSIFLFFVAGLSTFIFPDKYKAFIFSLFSFVAAVCSVIPAFRVIYYRSHLQAYNISINKIIGLAKFELDSLSAFFIIIISIISFICSLYSIGYIKHYIDKNKSIGMHFFFFGTLVASMLALCICKQSLMFIIIWEIMSLSSFLASMFYFEKEETVKAGINYLVTMHIGAVFLIVGFFGLNKIAGSLSFDSYRSAFIAHPVISGYLAILLCIGFSFKAGFIPVHSWLPKAHPAAPSHISALMSGVMIKTGLYGILRVITFLPSINPMAGYALITISIISALYGISNAIVHQDIKRALAYSSIENIGIAGIGLGFGILGIAYGNSPLAIMGFCGGFFHILNHSIFKPLLFFGAGNIYQKTGLLDGEKLGGLSKIMPYTSVFFLMGCLSISGLPLFNGFAGEFIIYLSMIKSSIINTKFSFGFSILIIGAFALTGAFVLFCFSKLYGIVFLGSPRFSRDNYHSQDDGHKHEAEIASLTAMAILTVLILIIGIKPTFVYTLILAPSEFIITSISPKVFIISEALKNVYNPLLILSSVNGILLFVLIIGFVLRCILLKNKKIDYYKTWDCGYQLGNSRMQYTNAAFVSPLLSLVKIFAGAQISKIRATVLFPKNIEFIERGFDRLEKYLIQPCVNFILEIMRRFSWIQSGNTQAYILYGVIFLISLIAVVILS